MYYRNKHNDTSTNIEFRWSSGNFINAIKLNYYVMAMIRIVNTINSRWTEQFELHCDIKTNMSEIFTRNQFRRSLHTTKNTIGQSHKKKLSKVTKKKLGEEEKNVASKSR